jgi:RNA polymerase sigma-70 factor, ECF subfamily
MNGREERIQALYTELGPALLAYARSLLRDAALAEDAVQQVFLKLLARVDLPIPDDARPYFFRAVRNTSSNVRRSAVRALAPPEPIFVAKDGLADLIPDLERALDELPDDQRQVLVLRVWGGLTLQQAADVLEAPLNTVASRYRYALAKLRQRFEVSFKS